MECGGWGVGGVDRSFVLALGVNADGNPQAHDMAVLLLFCRSWVGGVLSRQSPTETAAKFESCLWVYGVYGIRIIVVRTLSFAGADRVVWETNKINTITTSMPILPNTKNKRKKTASFLFLVLCSVLSVRFSQVLEGMVARRESPDSDTWLLLLNAIGTADALDKAVALMEKTRAEGQGSEVRDGVWLLSKTKWVIITLFFFICHPHSPAW